MDTTAAEREPAEDEIHMGSEYMDARSFLAREPRTANLEARKKKAQPQHGSNDSDFGIPDQRAD